MHKFTRKNKDNVCVFFLITFFYKKWMFVKNRLRPFDKQIQNMRTSGIEVTKEYAGKQTVLHSNKKNFNTSVNEILVLFS